MSYASNPGRTDNLLILRGLCSLGVLLVHCITLFPLSFDFGLFYPNTGANFVIIFFVLSGYLMGKIFWMGKYSLNLESTLHFYRNRFLRIAPLLYFSTAALIALNPGIVVGNVKQIIGDFLFINNFTGRIVNPVTWSISYEMQDYFLFPVIIYFFCSRDRNTFLACLGTIAALLFLSFSTDTIVLKWTWVFLSGYLVNILIRHVHERYKVNGSKLKTITMFFVFLLANLFFYVIVNTTGNQSIAYLQLVVVSMGVILVMELPYDQKETTQGEVFTWLGRISYGVYLWHFPLIIYFKDKITSFGMFTFTVLALTLIVSTVTFYLIEAKYRPSLLPIHL